MIGTLALDGWAVTFGTANTDVSRWAARLLAVPNVNSQSIIASVPTSNSN